MYLHIVPQPENALQEIKRVLKEDGVLIAPTFTHAGNSFSGRVNAFFAPESLYAVRRMDAKMLMI